MIGSTRQVAVHAFAAPADMRKSFDSLSLLVAQGLGRDVLSFPTLFHRPLVTASHRA